MMSEKHYFFSYKIQTVMLFTLKDEHKTQDHKFGVIQWRVPLLAVFPPEHLLRTDTLSERPQLLDKQAPQNHTETSALA